MRLWLLRHGETEANVAGLYSGHSPTPLTPKGLAQAETLHELLIDAPFDYVLCSELERAQQTVARVLRSRDLQVHTTPLLNEMFFGDWEMRHHRDLTLEDAESYAAWCTDWQHAVPTNGEGFQAFSSRIERVIDLIKALKGEYNNVLITSHQGVLSLLIARLLNMPAASLWHFRVDQGCWSALDIYDDYATLRVLNSRAMWRFDES